MANRAKRWIQNFFIALFMIATIAVNLLPVYWLAATAVKHEDDQFDMPPKWIFTPTLKHFAEVFGPESRYTHYFRNSVVVVLFSTLLVMALGVPAAYSIGCLKLKRKKDIAFYMLTLRFGAPIAFIIPLFVMFKQVGLLDTYYALILVYTLINLPLVVWLMKGFFQELPIEMLEAAKLDGCSDLMTMIRIAMPCVIPGIIASAIISMIFSWNEFFFALSLTGEVSKTAPVAMYQYISVHGAKWGQLCAAGILTVIPVLVFTAIVQEYVVKGMTFGAIKG